MIESPLPDPEPPRRIRWVRTIVAGVILGLIGVAIGRLLNLH
ncbi:hypothetical protein [Sphingomonas sp.]|nr:hypothetical protein [Sphingomonas sp.]